MSSLLPERPAFHFDPSEAFGEPRKAVTSTSRADYPHNGTAAATARVMGPFVRDNDPLGDKPPKHVTSTSIQAYRQIEPSLPAREAAVLDALAKCKVPPTGKELMARMGEVDPNRVRPRIFELRRRGLVRLAGKRVCTVSGMTTFTWEISHE